MKNKLKLIAMTTGLGTLAGLIATGCGTVRGGYESAPYQVVRANGTFELRDYPALTVVETPMAGGGDGSDGSFNRLFRFISGGNETQQKIAMTTPVFMSGGETNATMAFVMPAKMKTGEVPKPSEGSVTVRELAAGRFAVLRYSGGRHAKNEAEALALFARVGRKLIDSIRHPTVVRDATAARTFSIRPIPTSEAIARALRNEDSHFARTRWSDALSSASTPRQWGGARFGNRLVDSRSTRVSASAPRVFATVEQIGGRAGWHCANWLWTARGWLDLLVGGVGMRRGRRDPARLQVGDVVDCWRVETIDRNRRLRLQAEMKLPGRAWLDFEVRPDGPQARLSQTAIFDPVGLWGLAYWYAVWPLHQLVFAGMLRGLARAAEKSA